MPAAPDFFALFGLAPTLSIDAGLLRKKFYELSRQYHPDRFPAQDKAAQTEALAQTAQLNIAYRSLNDADALLGYVLRREGVLQEEEHYQLPADFLMEMMELNEAIDSEGGQAALAEALENWELEMAPMRAQFENGSSDPALWARLKDYYFRKKYLNRITRRLA